MKYHTISFRHAFAGIFYTFRSQPNAIIHTFFALIAILAGFIFALNYLEWLILLFTIVLVFVAEMINTALESMTDLITSQYHQQAKVAKDVSAGMVLIATLGSLIVGLVIFLPKIVAII